MGITVWLSSFNHFFTCITGVTEALLPIWLKLETRYLSYILSSQ
uniref:Uncharacterized protein n=1 Tax=Rhizophora mucronata TaxID=61149 RepID=A0A2P2NZC5_RHIMU